MHTTLALVLAVSLAADGGVDQLYTACPDAPLAVQVDGGWFMPEARWARTNCRLAACETFVAGTTTPEEVAAPPAWVWVVAAASVVATFAAGVYVGVKAEQALRP